MNVDDDLQQFSPVDADGPAPISCDQRGPRNGTRWWRKPIFVRPFLTVPQRQNRRRLRLLVMGVGSVGFVTVLLIPAYQLAGVNPLESVDDAAWTVIAAILGAIIGLGIAVISQLFLRHRLGVSPRFAWTLIGVSIAVSVAIGVGLVLSWGSPLGNPLVLLGVWVLLQLMSVVGLGRWFRSHGRGACATCGYRIAGIRSGRCPECGTNVGGAL